MGANAEAEFLMHHKNKQTCVLKARSERTIMKNEFLYVKKV